MIETNPDGTVRTRFPCATGLACFGDVPLRDLICLDCEGIRDNPAHPSHAEWSLGWTVLNGSMKPVSAGDIGWPTYDESEHNALTSPIPFVTDDDVLFAAIEDLRRDFD